MADRAPLDEASVSAAAAIKSVKTRRAVRVTANSFMGAGAAAVVAFAIIVPTLGAGGDDPESPLAATKVGEESAGADAMFDDTRLAVGFCGGAVGTQLEGQPGSLAIGGVPEELAEGGSVTTYDVTLTASDAIEGAFGTPTVFVVWEGTVVGTAFGPGTEAASAALAAGESVTTPVDVPLVNCWDGSPLPGGAYQLVASQDVFTASAPVPEPAVEVDPLVDPASDSAPGEATDSNSAAIEPVTTYDAGYSFVSEPVVFKIDGDVPEDPFGQYLNPAMPELPEGFLTPEKARELYAASLVTTGWDMAKGTQRVLMTNDSAVTDGSLWEDNYFGCAWDGSTGRPFPATSSEMPLIGVTASVPSQVSLSYGWVIDGNPQVDVSATNISEHVLPQLYEPNASLVLVKDGKVVAEAYLTSLNRNPEYTQGQYFEADDIVSGKYLWRDVNGCWANDGQLPVEPGTYTVLNQQYVYLSSDAGGVVWYGDALSSKYDGGMTGGGTAGTSGVAEPATAPEAAVAPDAAESEKRSADLSIAPSGEFVEFQVWTSLGTVKITS
jgi:hypothetical protein